MKKNIIIVGAGIAGLSAGIYARMNGYKTTILEMHSIPGGLCTAWKRKKYNWDISMHLVTCSKKGPFRQMWQELGVVDHHTFHYHHEFMRIENGDKSLSFGTDKNEVQKAMLAISPVDRKAINQFVNLLYGKNMMSAATLKPSELSGPLDHLKMFLAILPLLGTFIKFSKKTIQDLASEFKDPFLQKAARYIIDSPGWPMQRYPAVAMTGFIESAMTDAGTPLGGSQQVMFGMAELFKKLGGEIIYKSTVTDLIRNNDKITGVKLQNGTEYHADTVIWAADGHHLIYEILGSKYINDEITHMYKNWIPVLPLVHVMIGVNRDMSQEPHRLILKAENPIEIAGEQHQWVSFLHHCFDPSSAPAGKSAVEVWYATNYEYWHTLSQDKEKYEKEKKRIADCTIRELDKRWPGFASQVEVVDVPTPVTYTRYTGNWKGSPDGWYITPENMTKTGALRTLPGLQGLYMIGQWTAPYTGTVIAALTGRQIIQIICKKDRLQFKSQADR